jgi:hypothetical protein
VSVDAPKLDLILARDRANKFALWACRGAGKGCKRNSHRARSVPCEDCFGPLPEQLTLAEVIQRIEKGDA